MPRIREEKPVNKVRFSFEGSDEDVVKYMKAASFEYIKANLVQIEKEIHKDKE